LSALLPRSDRNSWALGLGHARQPSRRPRPGFAVAGYAAIRSSAGGPLVCGQPWGTRGPLAREWPRLAVTPRPRSRGSGHSNRLPAHRGADFRDHRDPNGAPSRSGRTLLPMSGEVSGAGSCGSAAPPTTRGSSVVGSGARPAATHQVTCHVTWPKTAAGPTACTQIQLLMVHRIVSTGVQNRVRAHLRAGSCHRPKRSRQRDDPVAGTPCSEGPGCGRLGSVPRVRE
jgi:hypothetical protein